MAITGILDDQKIQIDNHHRTKEIKEIKNLHLHKRTTKSKNGYGDIRIYIDGKVQWDVSENEGGKKLNNEFVKCLNRLSEKRLSKFFSDIAIEITKFDNNQTSNDEISLNILKAFYTKHNYIYGIQLIRKTTKKVFGANYEVFEYRAGNKLIQIEMHKRVINLEDISKGKNRYLSNDDIKITKRGKKD